MYNDPSVINLAKALRQKESGNNPNPTSHITQTEGSVGAYQFLPKTFQGYAQKYLGGKDLNGGQLDINNPDHQNLVAYKYIEDKKNQGYGVDQIAASWNAGEGALNDYKNRVGVNKYGNAYDVPKYANDVVNLYQKFKGETPNQPDTPQEQPQTDQPSILGSIANTFTKPFQYLGGSVGQTIGKPILQVGAGLLDSLIENTGGFGGEQSFSQKLGDKLQTPVTQIQAPYGGQADTFGYHDNQKLTPMGTAKQFAGNALQAGATFVAPESLLGTTATGTAFGAGATLADDPNASAGKVAVNTALGAGLGALPRTSIGLGRLALGKSFFPQTAEVAAKGVVKELSNVVANNAPLRKIVGNATDKGLNVIDDIAKSGLLPGTIDKSGTIRAESAISQLNDFIKPQEDIVSATLQREGRAVSPDLVKTRLVNAVNESGLKGGAKVRALKNVADDLEGYMLDATPEGLIPVKVIHDAKVDKYANINFLNPETKRADKAIAKGLKGLVEENTTSLDVKKANEELSKYYTMQNFLEKLDGKKVDGGKLGKYFSQIVGTIVGGHIGGIPGAIAGGETASALKGIQMANKFGEKTGVNLENSSLMKDAINQSKQPMGLLPQSNMRGSLYTNQTTAKNPTINDIYSDISQKGELVNKLKPQSTEKTSGKMGGFGDLGLLSKLGVGTAVGVIALKTAQALKNTEIDLNKLKDLFKRKEKDNGEKLTEDEKTAIKFDIQRKIDALKLNYKKPFLDAKPGGEEMRINNDYDRSFRKAIEDIYKNKMI